MQYIVQQSGEQPPARVNQMAPCQAGAVNPKEINALLDAMALQNQAPMSSSDSVTIVIADDPYARDVVTQNYPSAYSQQADAMGRQLIADERAQAVNHNAAELLAQLFSITRGQNPDARHQMYPPNTVVRRY